MELPPIDLTNAETQREQIKNNKSFVRRYWMFFGGCGVLVIGLLFWTFYASPHVSATKISDKTFVKNANVICAQAMPKLNKQQLAKNENISNTQLVSRVRTTADSIGVLRNDLSVVAVQPTDQSAVNDWIGNWTAYVDAGYRYADALAAGDKKQWMRIGNESETYSQRITAFAFVNHITSCELKTVVPARSGI